MKRFIFRLIVLACSALIVSACFGPKTPQDVTKTFWQAVLNNDTGDAVKYSTLTDASYYDGFSREWKGFVPSFGKITIEENQASVASEFAAPANSGLKDRRFTTYLVLRNNEWKVDYDRTKTAIHGGALGALFGKLGQLGDDLTQQLHSSADSFNREMERMARELEQMSDSFGTQASKSMEEFAGELRRSIDELEASINRALEEEDNNLSDKDRRVLQSIAADLEQDSQNLADPSAEAISESSKNLGRAQQQLVTIDGDALDKYKSEWQELASEFEKSMQKMLDELSKITTDDSVHEFR